jgi:hypothetical protein
VSAARTSVRDILCYNAISGKMRRSRSAVCEGGIADQAESVFTRRATRNLGLKRRQKWSCAQSAWSAHLVVETGDQVCAANALPAESHDVRVMRTPV